MKTLGSLSIIAALALFTIFPIKASAHGSLFYEFAPDISSPLKVSLVQTPSQPFKPANDYLGGFDVWIDNVGAAGTASFGLRDSGNTLLASKTATIGTVAPAWGGARFHVDFDNQVPISSGQIYKIRIVSSMPELRLYRASQSQLLQHTSSGYADYEVEPALLGSQEQNFTFKFALYETSETSPPVISNATTSIISLTTAKLEFNANEPVDYKVDYGPTSLGLNQSTGFTGNYRLCLPGKALCSAEMNVSPSTNYLYTLTAKDEWGNEGGKSGSFRSAEGLPSPSPQPSGTPGPGNPTPSPGSSPTPSLSASPSPSPSPPAGSPRTSPAPSPGRTPGIGSSPSPENSPTPPGTSSSPENSPSPKIEVRIENQSGTGAASGATAIITWNPPAGQKADNYRIDIFDAEKKLVKQVIVSAETRKLVVEKLAEGRYLIYVYAVNDGELTQIGEPIEFIVGMPALMEIFPKRKLAIIALITAAALGLLSALIKKLRAGKGKPPQLESRSKSIFDKIKDNG